MADFFARSDFTVRSRTQVAGLELGADDGPFAAGTGPLVTGSTLALVMAMAGRAPYLAELDGPGVPILRSRLQVEASEGAGAYVHSWHSGTTWIQPSIWYAYSPV